MDPPQKMALIGFSFDCSFFARTARRWRFPIRALEFSRSILVMPWVLVAVTLWYSCSQALVWESVLPKVLVCGEAVGGRMEASASWVEGSLVISAGPPEPTTVPQSSLGRSRRALAPFMRVASLATSFQVMDPVTTKITRMSHLRVDKNCCWTVAFPALPALFFRALWWEFAGMLATGSYR